MGILTNLISMNEDKKRKDRQDEINNYQHILALPDDVMPKETKDWAAKGLSGILGEGLGLKKKDHGIVHGLLSSLAGLNPNPSAPPPAAGTPPTFKPVSPEQGRQIRMSRLEEPTLAQGEAGAVVEKKAHDVTQANIDKLYDNGSPGALITREEAGEASLANDLPGFRLSRTPASAIGTRKNVQVKTPEGQILQLSQDSRSGKFYPLGGGTEEVPVPEGTTIYNAPKPVNDPAQWRQKILEYTNAGFNPDEAQQMTSWYFRQLDAANLRKSQQQAQNLSQTNQIQSDLSGDAGRAAPSEAAPFTSPGHPTRTAVHAPTMGLGPAPRPTGVGSTPTTPAAPTARTTATPAPKPAATPGASAAPAASSKGLNPVSFQTAIDSDPQMRAAHQYLAGIMKARASGASMVGINKGIAKIRNLIKQRTGKEVTDTQLSSELTAREGVKAAYKLGQESLAAYDKGAMFVNVMADAVRNAKAKFGDNPVFWQKVLNHFNNNITGDPDTSALVQALNGYQNAYARIISNGALSKAQTHVSATEMAEKITTPNMNMKQLESVFNQVSTEMKGDREALIRNNSAMNKRLSADIGSFDQTNNDPANDPTQDRGNGGGLKLPKPTNKNQLISSDQAYLYLQAAGGDREKATKMAQGDGWRVK